MFLSFLLQRLVSIIKDQHSQLTLVYDFNQNLLFDDLAQVGSSVANYSWKREHTHFETKQNKTKQNTCWNVEKWVWRGGGKCADNENLWEKCLLRIVSLLRANRSVFDEWNRYRRFDSKLTFNFELRHLLNF